jgi:hypothetical protein
MELLNKDNARLGAKITKNGKSFFIYKINDKSFYAGEETYPVIISKWENRVSGTTWKIFMEQNGGKQEEYKDFILEKNPDVAYEAKRTKQKNPISATAEREVRKLYQRFLDDKGKSYRHIVEMGKEVFKIVEANKEKQVLLSVDGNFVFFDMEQDKYTKWREVSFGGQSEIPWPKKSIGETL